MYQSSESLEFSLIDLFEFCIYFQNDFFVTHVLQLCPNAGHKLLPFLCVHEFAHVKHFLLLCVSFLFDLSLSNLLLYLPGFCK